MRLICPNCDAQYEVPIEVMPEEGRDVQCSNCSQTWFQDHPDHPSETESDADADSSQDDTVETASPAASEAKEFTADSDTGPEDEEETELPEDLETEMNIPGRRELDKAVADVLRAEAELEAEARRKEREGLETQPDLGLAEAPLFPVNREQDAQKRKTETRGDYFEDEDDMLDELVLPAISAVGSHRAELPDVEEINSTLRSDEDRTPDLEPEQLEQLEEQEKRSSRLGFVLTIAVFAALAVLYAFAPTVIENAPQAAPALDAYVSTVDTGREWLNSKVALVLSWLDGAAAAGE